MKVFKRRNLIYGTILFFIDYYVNCHFLIYYAIKNIYKSSVVFPWSCFLEIVYDLILKTSRTTALDASSNNSDVSCRRRVTFGTFCYSRLRLAHVSRQYEFGKNPGRTATLLCDATVNGYVPFPRRPLTRAHE